MLLYLCKGNFVIDHQKIMPSLATKVYWVINGLAPKIINSAILMKKLNYNLRKYTVFRSGRINTVRYRRDSLTYLDHEVWSIVLDIQRKFLPYKILSLKVTQLFALTPFITLYNWLFSVPKIQYNFHIMFSLLFLGQLAYHLDWY